MMSRVPPKTTIPGRTWLLVLCCALFAACSETPQERLAQARTAADDKDLEKFTKFFTERSAGFLRDLVRNGDRSKIRYLRDPFSFLPEGDVDYVTTAGKSTLLKIKGKRGSAEIRMFLENDEWAIDVFSLKALWDPLYGEMR
jgi:hypothetical protein